MYPVFTVGRRHPVMIGMLLVGAAVVFYAATRPGRDRPDNEQAGRFLDSLFKEEVRKLGKYARVDLVAPDGEKAKAHPSLLGKATVLGCPTMKDVYLRNRFGAFNRSKYHCLYRVAGPEGLVFHIAAYVTRDEDITLPFRVNGYGYRLLSAEGIRDLMKKLNVRTRAYSRDEQARLWAQLARLGITVPADKTRRIKKKKKESGPRLILDGLGRF